MTTIYLLHRASPLQAEMYGYACTVSDSTHMHEPLPGIRVAYILVSTKRTEDEGSSPCTFMMIDMTT